MKKLIVIIVVIVAVAVSVGAYYMNKGTPEPTVTTAQLSRGDIVDAVQATGTLEAVTTVLVGTQVSGTVQDLYADFNDFVKKGQVIARLDPSLIQTQIEQQKANVTRSEADLERLKVSLADARQKLERARALAEKNLLPRTELETAEVNVRSAEAQIKSSEAGLVQARSQLNTQQVNLGHTVITAPIDGIVISREVEPGQTVAASMNAPTLFTLAADLREMQVNANIDEADVGRMRPGQHVTFRVDAFPTDTFTGTVQQVRLQPTTVQNVVTYQTVISVPNPEMKLKPGMTANVSIEIAHKTNVLRIPNAALRFRPTNEMFAALNQPVPPELQRGQGGFGRGRNGQGGQPGATGAPAAQGATSSGAPNAQSAPAGGGPTAARQNTPRTGGQPEGQAAAQPQRQREGSPAENRGGGDPGASGENRGRFGGRGGFDPNLTPEERQKRIEERMAQMTPEERERFQQRMRERAEQGGFGRGGDRAQGGGAGAARQGDQAPSSAAPRRNQAGRVASTPAIATTATTIDALFGPLPQVESRGRAWLWANKQLKSVSLRLGISDGTYTEVLGDAGGLQPGQDVVINLLTGLEPKTTTPGQTGGSQNPLMGPQRGGPGRGGPGGGRR